MSIKEFLFIDMKDITNWVAVLIAMPLLWWGIKTLFSGIKF